MEKPATKRPGRPPGLTKAAGAKVSTGRPPGPAAPRSATYPARLAHWRQWFASQQQVSAYELAKRMEQTARTVQRYASSHEPPEVALLNLESLSSAYGYAPLTSEHQVL